MNSACVTFSPSFVFCDKIVPSAFHVNKDIVFLHEQSLFCIHNEADVPRNVLFGNKLHIDLNNVGRLGVWVLSADRLLNISFVEMD